MTTQFAELKPFIFQSHLLRVQADEHGNPWVCAKDVCDILGYTNSSKAISDHCKPEGVSMRDVVCDLTNRYPTSKARNTQSMAFINEGNLYRLIIKSNMPAAERFESWVCDEVLPTIRKTGRYEAHCGTGYAATLDRETASRINPLISSLWTEETLESLALVTRELSFFLSAKEQIPDTISTGQMYLLMGTIAAALEYEAFNPCMQNRKLPKLKEV